jgi:phosphatidylglycerol:prolipoprotein diacylglycerol transferase
MGGFLSVKLYGLMIAIGIMAGSLVVEKIAKREGVDEDLIWGAIPWMMVGGIVGARLYHVIDLWGYYSQHFMDIIKVWSGGVGIFGGILGGLIGLILSIKYQVLRGKGNTKIPNIWSFLDLFAFGVPVAQAIGRWGNFFNQELYGAPTNLPWGIYISLEHRAKGLEQFTHFQPLFLYESILDLLLFGIMILIYRWQRPHPNPLLKGEGKWRVGDGRFAGIYLVGYGLIRFILEFMRVGNWKIEGVATAQLVSMGMIVIGSFLLIKKIGIVK